MMDQRPGPQAYARAAHLRWLPGDLEGAIDLMRRAARATGARSPGAAAWAHTRLARLLRQAHLGHEAVAHIRAALVLAPDYPPARLEQGLRHLAQGRAAEAIIPLRRAVDSNPLPETLWALMEALQTAGRRCEALALERRMRSRGERDDPRTYALYLAGRGLEPDTALRLARAELSVRADVFTLDALAWALHAAGRDREAQAYSARALSEGTRDARLFYHAGVIAAAGGDDAQARDRLNRALALRHMLLPSERAGLAKALAALGPQTPRLAVK
jgi:tetratricopeptide (TPR) repeat protein